MINIQNLLQRSSVFIIKALVFRIKSITNQFEVKQINGYLVLKLNKNYYKFYEMFIL